MADETTPDVPGRDLTHGETIEARLDAIEAHLGIGQHASDQAEPQAAPADTQAEQPQAAADTQEAAAPAPAGEVQ